MNFIDTYLQQNDFKNASLECLKNGEPILSHIISSFLNLNTLISNITSTTPDISNNIITNKVIDSKPIYYIRLLCNWSDSKTLCNLWNKMSKGNYSWGSIKIGWDFDRDPDYYVIINSTNEYFVKEKTILFQMEPNMHKHPEIWKQWSNPNKSDFLHIFKHSDDFNNCEYHLSKTYSELLSSSPTKLYDTTISTILSEKYKDIGQIKRIDFVKFLDTKDDITIDVFGNNKWEYKNYKHPLPYHQKDDGLFPYKYTFNCENNKIDNYITEKFYDAILSECLIFYWGSDNLCELIDNRAYINLSLSNFDMDYIKIKKIIQNNEWEKRLPYIRQAKQLILNKLQFFPRLEEFINSLHSK